MRTGTWLAVGGSVGRGEVCGGVGWQRRRAEREEEERSSGRASWSGPVKALVWFWLIDETLSANLVY